MQFQTYMTFKWGLHVCVCVCVSFSIPKYVIFQKWGLCVTNSIPNYAIFKLGLCD